MKTFKYKHTTAVYVLSALIMLFMAVGCFFGVRSAILAQETPHLIAYVLLTAISFFLFVLAFSIIICSRYTVKNGKIIMRFGIVRQCVDLDDVQAMVHLIDVKKIAVCFTDEKYLFIIIKPEDIERFADAVKKEKPTVLYDVCYSAEPDDKKR